MSDTGRRHLTLALALALLGPLLSWTTGAHAAQETPTAGTSQDMPGDALLAGPAN
jgi:hypothetical protein